MEEQNEEEVEETTDEETTEEETNEEEESEEESTDLEAKVKELEGRNKRLQTKLDKKAKTTKANKTKENQSEPDYGKQAYLNSVDIKNADDQKMVMDEAERLKLPLTDIIAMKHMKADLKDASDQRKLEEGMPKGRGKSGSGTKGSVEYHLANNTTPDDQKLAEEVINARMKKEGEGNPFSDELYTG